MDASSQSSTERSAWWRVVLGEFPTGVALVTSREGGGALLGMVVGSFVAISQNPPLVGFFVGANSRSFAAIERAGRFGISILGDRREQLSRDVATKAADALRPEDFVTTASGAPRLRDAVVWFDAAITRSDEYGDHRLIVCAINDFGVGSADAGMPLMFRRAGYGSFAAPSEPYDSQAFIDRLRWSSLAEAELAALADHVGTRVTVNTQLGDSIVLLQAFDPQGVEPSDVRAGASYPFAAPIGAIFAAWASTRRRHAWTEASRHLVGTVDRDLIAQQIEGIRRRGYGIAAQHPHTTNLTARASDASTGRDALVTMWHDIADVGRALESDSEVHWDRVSGFQVPVFDPNGDVVLGIGVSGLPPFGRSVQVDAVAKDVRGVAALLAERIGHDLSP